MSMNIFFEASRVIQVVKTGVTEVQKVQYQVWQTPTEITFQILRAEDPIQTYKDWVMTQSEDIEEPVFAEDDLWEEGEPVGSIMRNDAKEHIAELDQWLAAMEQGSWTVKPAMI